MSVPDHPRDNDDEPDERADFGRSEDLRTVDGIVSQIIKNRQQNYGHHLLDNQLEFIHTGDVTRTDQHRSTVASRIPEKASQLPERLSQLLTDLAMLYRHGDGDLNELAPAAWTDFVNSHDWLLHRVLENPVALPDRDAHNPRLELGYELGYLARLLLKTGDCLTSDQASWEDTVRGFTLAFFDHPDEQPDGDDYEAMLQSLAEAEGSRRADVAALDDRFQTLQAAFTDSRTPDRIRAALRDHEFPVDETLVETIRSEVPEAEVEETRAAIERIVTGLETDAIRAAVGTHEAFEADVARLTDITEYQGVKPAEILEFLLHSGDPETVQTLYGELYHHGKETGVRATLNRLAAEQPGDTWINVDFVQDANSGWTLTPYGCIGTLDLLGSKPIDDWFAEYYRYHLRDLVHQNAVDTATLDGLTGTAFDEDIVDLTRLSVQQFHAASENGSEPDEPRR